MYWHVGVVLAKLLNFFVSSTHADKLQELAAIPCQEGPASVEEQVEEPVPVLVWEFDGHLSDAGRRVIFAIDVTGSKRIYS